MNKDISKHTPHDIFGIVHGVSRGTINQASKFRQNYQVSRLQKGFRKVKTKHTLNWPLRGRHQTCRNRCLQNCHPLLSLESLVQYPFSRSCQALIEHLGFYSYIVRPLLSKERLTIKHLNWVLSARILYNIESKKEAEPSGEGDSSWDCSPFVHLCNTVYKFGAPWVVCPLWREFAHRELHSSSCSGFGHCSTPSPLNKFLPWIFYIIAIAHIIVRTKSQSNLYNKKKIKKSKVIYLHSLAYSNSIFKIARISIEQQLSIEENWLWAISIFPSTASCQL